MNYREVKPIKIILRTSSNYKEMKNIKGCNSEFTIHNYDYRNSWQYATPNLEFSKDNYDNLQR